ncbi:MAG: hypothetical protein ACYCT7_06915 [bacterium]
MDFSLIIKDNENILAGALEHGDYVKSILLAYSLIESLLRMFLNEHNEEIKFTTLIKKYKDFLLEEKYVVPTFVKELQDFNKRRNRIIHQLWSKGYTFTNRQAEDAAVVSVNMYGLFIEFLQTLDENLIKIGFKYE